MAELEMHVLVSGRVQGVGFRYKTLSHAQRLGLKGFVRNLPNGKVEILAQGKEEDLKKLLLLLKTQVGPALIQDIEKKVSPIQEKLSDFSIKK
ncbi:Acylphosphatase [Chlamydiales bacterium STE3]|nr:Acylphosphatase [Chlamydiales bacterium STE3]